MHNNIFAFVWHFVKLAPIPSHSTSSSFPRHFKPYRTSLEVATMLIVRNHALTFAGLKLVTDVLMKMTMIKSWKCKWKLPSCSTRANNCTASGPARPKQPGLEHKGKVKCSAIERWNRICLSEAESHLPISARCKTCTAYYIMSRTRWSRRMKTESWPHK